MPVSGGMSPDIAPAAIRDTEVWDSLRLRPMPAYVYAALEATMRVDDLVRKTVVYVGYEANGQFVPYGTGFLCFFRFDGAGFSFIATATHVVKSIPEGDYLYVRANRNEGGSSVVRAEKRYIIYHKAPEVDLALIPVHLGFDIFDVRPIDVSRKALRDFGGGWEYGIGDEVCVSGLYTSHYGLIKNIPIIRIGHIAAMPEEPVQVNSENPVDGLIIELQSIAGLSGSPVFVNHPSLDTNKDGADINDKLKVLPIPLGMLLGHHSTKSRQDEIPVSEYQPTGANDPLGRLTKEVKKLDAAVFELSLKNTGFAVVIPIERITDIFEYPEVVQAMRRAVARLRGMSAFVPDAASGVDDSSADATADQLDDVLRHALVRRHGRDPLRKDANRRKN